MTTTKNTSESRLLETAERNEIQTKSNQTVDYGCGVGGGDGDGGRQKFPLGVVALADELVRFF
jgi:hypothetical protein